MDARPRSASAGASSTWSSRRRRRPLDGEPVAVGVYAVVGGVEAARLAVLAAVGLAVAAERSVGSSLSTTGSPAVPAPLPIPASSTSTQDRWGHRRGPSRRPPARSLQANTPSRRMPARNNVGPTVVVVVGVEVVAYAVEVVVRERRVEGQRVRQALELEGVGEAVLVSSGSVALQTPSPSVSTVVLPAVVAGVVLIAAEGGDEGLWVEAVDYSIAVEVLVGARGVLTQSLSRQSVNVSASLSTRRGSSSPVRGGRGHEQREQQADEGEASRCQHLLVLAAIRARAGTSWSQPPRLLHRGLGVLPLDFETPRRVHPHPG